MELTPTAGPGKPSMPRLAWGRTAELGSDRSHRRASQFSGTEAGAALADNCKKRRPGKGHAGDLLLLLLPSRLHYRGTGAGLQGPRPTSGPRLAANHRIRHMEGKMCAESAAELSRRWPTHPASLWSMGRQPLSSSPPSLMGSARMGKKKIPLPNRVRRHRKTMAPNQARHTRTLVHIKVTHEMGAREAMAERPCRREGLEVRGSSDA